MESAFMDFPQNQNTPKPQSRRHKRIKLSNDGGEECNSSTSKVVDYSDPFVIVSLFGKLDTVKYGSVMKDIEALARRRIEMQGSYLKMFPTIVASDFDDKSDPGKDALSAQHNVIDLDDDEGVSSEVPPADTPIVILDLDSEDNEDSKPFSSFQDVVLGESIGQTVKDSSENNSPESIRLDSECDINRDKVVDVERAVWNHFESNKQGAIGMDSKGDTNGDKGVNVGQPVRDHSECNVQGAFSLSNESDIKRDKGVNVGKPCNHVRDNLESTNQEKISMDGESDFNRDKGVYVGVVEEKEDIAAEADGLEGIWNQMSLALECSKDDVAHPSFDEHIQEGEEHCDHSFVLKDDLGYVCRICGVIKRGIETIIEIQFNKVRSSRTYMLSSRNDKDTDKTAMVGFEFSKNGSMVTNLSAHPRHSKKMKPHQVEGFNFLCRNLVGDNPGGCILAHAPGSGKTFMVISFLQSFLAKYPDARPLVVLPKGIVSTWKKEFLTWQVENIPLFDLYTVKADSRIQQLEILKQWMDQKSILFLGYKQFASIVCDNGNTNAATSCREILLKRPSILILDEGHTPRNEDTDVVQSLAKVLTPRKVVLSGTLYQNHVKEVFNILNLVRPKFLQMDTSRVIVKRIMSKVDIASARIRGQTAFFELIEQTIQKDNDIKRKETIIEDLREMTSKVLHYYKGDFLDELPGLVDFTVVLSLTLRQKHEVDKLKNLAMKFKRSSCLSAVSLHPNLSENSALTDDKMDELLEKTDVRDGVKAKFFLNILKLCESAGEKLLVFSQYLQPLKFLERLAVKIFGWSLDREIFVISGESTSEQREWSMEHFNNSTDAKVFFGSIKACGEGISLVGASRIIILDVHLNPSVTRQAIGRAFRPGQKKKVYAYRLVAADSPEMDDHSTCFRKEAIAKMWFEWNKYCGFNDVEMETIELEECGDLFLESPVVGKDVRALYKRY